MSPAERLARIRLARTSGIGPLTFRRLLSRFTTAVAAIDGLPELARAGGRQMPPSVTGASVIEAELARLAKLGGRMLVLGDLDYPPLLATLEDAPPAISIFGDPALLTRRAVGLVGARNASANGQRMAEALAADLASHGMLVVSGLARGIDTAAHIGALHTGTTVAAIAGGLDVPYPAENTALQSRIAEHGVVIAEAPLGTAPQSRHFPRRNRIIAGLSLGVVVVEAARHSGSLITAQLALDANRLVMAVPGSPLDPRCHGSNDLIRNGAVLVGQASDVVEALPDWEAIASPRLPLGFEETAPPYAAPAEPENGPEARAAIIRLLGPEPTPVDDLIRRCQLSASTVMAVLLVLELDGVVESLPGHRVALIA
ncbi:DNA-processing protein DprA [Acidisphaera sp. L21]|uniref:DNA-processing protein DprA n=1 Tax=Acidisphaera sp. L21 TaxID=1641851 RepID=UPI00131BF068|nr:DNA-processing protein DprA [Acidisphaera sp. L21]